MKRLVLLSWLLATLIYVDSFSQSREKIKNNFYDAESWILFEDYKEALPLYQSLLKIYPTNYNFKYRIGQCYINTPGEKEKSISYLEDAVKHINPKYREGKFTETGAPYDALYYLANAYRINNQLDKAVETYKRFQKNLNPLVYDSTIVKLQIQSCLNARELSSRPLYIKEKSLGNVINGKNSEFNPVVSDKEDMLVFSRSEAFYDAMFYSTRVNGQWSSPLNMNELLKVDKDIFPTSISKDGKDLYLYSSANYDGNIYKSHFENNIWSSIVKLNDNINTKYWESHATISHDNKKLYFTSNRKGTLGGLDIYVSNRESTGDWGAAENLGPVINTPYNEESPSLSQDDKTLFFSSRGHFNMGGYDIFYSTLHPDGEWSVPLNAGYPLNSTDDDVFFDPVNEGYEGYYSKYNQEGLGKQDIYRIEMFSDDHPRKFYVLGLAKVADLMSNIDDRVKISAMNIKNPGQTIVIYSNPKTGKYELQLPQGNFQITFEGEKSEKVVKNIELPLTNPSDSLILSCIILPGTDFIADINVKSNKNISAVKAGTTTMVFVKRENDITKRPVIRPEYTRIIVNKQITALYKALKARANDKLLTIVTDVNIEKQQFSKTDDLISYLKEEAAKKGINPEELDKLSLRVAVINNILTQAAVDLMAKYTDGDLKKILSDLDIYQANFKTWTDLQTYISEKTGGKISPEELNRIAAEILINVKQSLPGNIITSPVTTGKESRLWILWILLGAGLTFFFIIFRKRIIIKNSIKRDDR